MMLPKEIRQEAKKYSDGDNAKLEAFIAGAMFATTGKYYQEQKLEVSPTSEPVPTFDDWWEAYGKKCGRKKTEAKWNRLHACDKIACMKATPIYVMSTPDKQFRKHPLTYLNGECWKDEIIAKYNYDAEQQRAINLASKAARILSRGNQG